MKQIIPFKKELLFKTKVSEITSISLEHNLSLTEDDLVSGEFVITGDYKMTDASINREKFEFTLPFDIALDSRYDSKKLVIDIDNFYYEVVNNEFLMVNIDVYIEGEKALEEDVLEKEELVRSDDPRITFISPKNNDDGLIKPIVLPSESELNEKANIIDYKDDLVDYKMSMNKDLELDNQDNVIDLNINYQKPPVVDLSLAGGDVDNDFNLFKDMDNSDTYVTYHVYIVKENDTIDTIMEKYEVKKESLAIYNDLENVKPGTKMIIPYESRT